MVRLYDEYLKADGSFDRASIMRRAWRLARKLKGDIRVHLKYEMRAAWANALTARDIVLNADAEKRAKIGYAEIDRAAEWRAAA